MVGFFLSNPYITLIAYRRAIMFHIGVATQHPPLPEPDQLSELGTTFIKQCLTIDPVRRPTATELMNHPWMLELRETLMRYGDSELTAEVGNPSEDGNASVARQAAIAKEQEVEQLTKLATSSTSPQEENK
jgi:mitogen-activated protein kinase kinase kinase